MTRPNNSLIGIGSGGFESENFVKRTKTEASDENHVASDDLEGELEFYSETTGSHPDLDVEFHISSRELEEREPQNDEIVSPITSAPEDGEHEGDANYWKEMFLREKEKNAALEARLQDANL